MLPEKITIGCCDYEIQPTDEVIVVDARQCTGMISYERGIIKISNDDNRSEQMQELTLWHEIVHGIIHYRNFDPQKADIETTVEELARGLYLLCRQNGLLPGQNGITPSGVTG